MKEIVEKALSLWGMEGADWKLIAARENQVFRAEFDGKAVALRLHRQGYRTDAELWSELEWMKQADACGLHVPTPIRSTEGNFLHVVNGVQVDVLTWLAGNPVGKTGEELETADRVGLFFGIGREMARLHKISDEWILPQGFTRCSWDREGLLGETPIWDQFWKNPTLSDEDKKLFLKVRQTANTKLKDLENTLDYGLIHADLVRENIMVDGNRLQFIDFDDAGFGFRLFDLATTIIKNMQERDYPELKSALIRGYKSERNIDTSELDLFILLRALTYVGWIIKRMGEEGAKTRNIRFVDTARALASSQLAAL